jgi:hypothetical protein
MTYIDGDLSLVAQTSEFVDLGTDITVIDAIAGTAIGGWIAQRWLE